MSANASLSVDVVAVVVIEIEATVREVTADVMLARARRVHHLESLLLNCKFMISYTTRISLTCHQPWWIWTWTWWRSSCFLVWHVVLLARASTEKPHILLNGWADQ